MYGRDRALELLDTAATDHRLAGYERFGELIRSTSTAKQVLDRLTPREQLTVCGTWARNRNLQSVVYPRLRQLTRDAQLSGEAVELVNQLAQDSSLREVLRSHQLLKRTY